MIRKSVFICKRLNRKILKRLELNFCDNCGESYRKFKTVKGNRRYLFRNCPICGYDEVVPW